MNNTSGSATGSADVQITRSTLGGNGSIAGMADIGNFGTLAPGTSVGQLTVGSVQFSSSSIFAVELEGSGGVTGVDFDQLVTTGDAHWTVRLTYR